jgi:hypothetical protein
MILIRRVTDMRNSMHRPEIVLNNDIHFGTPVASPEEACCLAVEACEEGNRQQADRPDGAKEKCCINTPLRYIVHDRAAAEFPRRATSPQVVISGAQQPGGDKLKPATFTDARSKSA